MSSHRNPSVRNVSRDRRSADPAARVPLSVTSSSSLDSERRVEAPCVIDSIQVKKSTSGSQFIQLNMGDGLKERVRDLESTDFYAMLRSPHIPVVERRLLLESVCDLTDFMVAKGIKIDRGLTCWNCIPGNPVSFGVTATKGVFARFRADFETHGIILGANDDGSTAVHLEPMKVKDGIITNLIVLKAYKLYRIAGESDNLSSSAANPASVAADHVPTIIPFHDGLPMFSGAMTKTWPRVGFFKRDRQLIGREDATTSFPPNVVLIGNVVKNCRRYHTSLPLFDLPLCDECEHVDGIVHCEDANCFLSARNNNRNYCLRVVRSHIEVPLSITKPMFNSEYRRIRKTISKFAPQWHSPQDYLGRISEMTSIPMGAVIAIISGCDSLSSLFLPNNVWFFRGELGGPINQVSVPAVHLVGFVIAWKEGFYIHRQTGEQLVIVSEQGRLRARERIGDETGKFLQDDDVV